MNSQNRKTFADLKNDLQLLGWREGWGRDSQGDWDGHVHTAIFKIGNQQGCTVQHRELYSMLCGSLEQEGSFGENGYMCMYS